MIEIHAGGEMRVLGCLPRTRAPGEQFPVFADEWLIPRGSWQPISRRDWVPEIRDQDGVGCHDEDTDVLTDRGWVSWGSYDKRSRLATVNPLTFNMEFQWPTAFHAYEYNGEMISVDRRGLTFCVTPNHRMMVRNWNEQQRRIVDEFCFREVSNVGWYGKMLASPTGFHGDGLAKVTIGNKTYSGDDFVALVALVLSDGWISGDGTNKHHISYCCFRQDRLQMVRGLTARLGLHELPKRDGVVIWTDADLYHWLRTNAYVGYTLTSPFKKLPQVFRNLSQRQTELFLSFYGDQHVNKNNIRQFYTSSKQMADGLQELILRTGKRSAISFGKPAGTASRINGREVVSKYDSYAVTEWKSDEFAIEKKKLDSSHYRGYVFCATVPNSTLITRKHGTVLISGNSCNAFAACMAVRVSRRMVGKKDIKLSEGCLYGQINGGRDQGSMLGDALEALQKTGTCLDTTIGPLTWQKSKWPSGWQDEAKIYRLAEAWDCPTFEHIASAILLGFVVDYGIMVGNNFDVGNDGWVVPPSRGGGGHAMCGIGLAEKSGKWGIETVNSWSATWGDKGFGIVPESYFANQTFTDGWCLRSVVDETTDPLVKA